MSKAQNTFMIFGLAGGHPHNWNAISGECLSLLTELNQRLVSYHDSVATNGRAKSLSTASERKTSSETSGEIFILHFYTLGLAPFTFFLCDLKSYFRCWRSNESKADITLENPGLCICPHCYRHPKEPSDGTIHSWPGQPIYVSHPASTYHSCRTMLAVVGHIAEPTCDEARCEALVHIHRWGGTTNHHYFIFYVTLGIKFTLEVKTFGLVIMSICLRIKTWFEGSGWGNI